MAKVNVLGTHSTFTILFHGEIIILLIMYWFTYMEFWIIFPVMYNILLVYQWGESVRNNQIAYFQLRCSTCMM